jgi:hypothetical protein
MTCRCPGAGAKSLIGVGDSAWDIVRVEVALPCPTPPQKDGDRGCPFRTLVNLASTRHVNRIRCRGAKNRGIQRHCGRKECFGHKEYLSRGDGKLWAVDNYLSAGRGAPSTS